MYKDLNAQLVQIKGKMSKKKKWETQVADYKVELAEIEDTIAELEDQLTEEMKDVKKLEGIGLTSLFQTFFGAKEEKLRKEKQEVVAVQLQLKEARKTQKEIIDSISSLEDKLHDVATIENEYQNILSRKEEIISESRSASTRELYNLSEKAGDIQANITELCEAIEAGEVVENALDHAVSSLESAEGWGTFDMFGGGMISGIVKHGHIDDATEYIHQAQTKMRSFQKELLDVNEAADLHIDISGLLKFADFFFDGIIADWMVQGRIQDSLEQARSQQSNITQIISNLKAEMEKQEADLTALEIEKNTWIEKF